MNGISSVTAYTFDAAGNRLTKTVDGVETVYTYDANDRILSDGVQTFTYDNNGNTLNDGTKTFSYDARNRLESFVSGADTVNYTYDNDGLRTSKTVNGTTTNFVLCKTCRYARVIEENENGSLKAKYTYGNDILGVRKAGETYGFILDGHGSVRMMTYGGLAVAGYDYDAYGNNTGETGFMSSENDFRYTGEQYDPDLDQYYLRSRYYNQTVGRFSSMDTWGGSASRPLSLNKYNYTESNPVMGRDPSGRMNLLELSAVIAVLEVLATTSLSAPTLVTCKGKESSHKNKYKLFDTMDEAAMEAERKGFEAFQEDIRRFEVAVEISWEKPNGCGKECFYANEAHMGYEYWDQYTGNTYSIPHPRMVSINWGVMNIAGFWHSHTGDVSNSMPSDPNTSANLGGDTETVKKIRDSYYPNGYGYLTTAEDRYRVKFGASNSEEAMSW